MSTPPEQLTTAVENEEGFRSHAYWDPIGQCWTVAYGETGPQVGPTTVRTRQQGVEWLQATESKLISGLLAAEPWMRELSAPRFGAMVDAAYNLGINGLDDFHEAFAAMKVQDWKGAVHGFENSIWYRQVPSRVNAISYMVMFDDWLENYPDADQLAQLATALHE